MADCMSFPQTWEQFLHDYEFEDARRIYTNGAKLMPSFRVKQMMEHYLLGSKSEAIRRYDEKLWRECVRTMDNDSLWWLKDIRKQVLKEMVGDDDA